MPTLGWRVHFTRRRLMMPRSARPILEGLPVETAGWLDREGIDDGVPVPISPYGDYDVDLNSYFLAQPQSADSPQSTHS
jgi:hypothetical protein